MKKFAVAIYQKTHEEEALSCIIVSCENEREALGRAMSNKDLYFENFAITAYHVTEIEEGKSQMKNFVKSRK
jgi:hypothetical protein